MNQVQELLRAAILERTLKLPSLPGVAARVAEVARDENATARKLADAVGADPALAARLMRVANSSLYRGSSRTDRLDLAIARIGIATTRRMVIALSLKMANVVAPPMIQKRMAELWMHSVEVAAISRVLAANFTKLSPEEAMLAGLLHRIGALPILSMACDTPDMLKRPSLLDQALEAEHARVGTMLLQSWNFPKELAEVPLNAADRARRHAGPPDYADVVVVATVETATQVGEAASADYSSVPAFSALGLEPTQDTVVLAGFEDQIVEARSLLS